MAPSRTAHITSHATVFLTALCVLCLSACAAASSALASPLAKAGSSHAIAPVYKAKRHKHGHLVKCAKRSTFHTAIWHAHHLKLHVKKGHAKCRKRHAPAKAHHKAKRPATALPPAASHSSACAGADLRPSQANLELVRAATLCLVNRERTTRGESPLQPDGHLSQSAQGHSEDMAAGDYFEHVGRHGDTPLTRMRAAGYFPSLHIGYEVGENISWGTLWMASPREMVASWMASPGHRANILDDHYHDSGIGISPHGLASLDKGQTGAMYTEDFGVLLTP